MAVDLASLYESLVLPLGLPSGTNLSAVPIPDSQTHRLAKDSSGSPCLLLRQPIGATRPAPIRLQNLFVSYDVPCTITDPSGRQEGGNFTIIKCSNADPNLFPHFLRIISPMVVALGPTPTSAAVRRAISGLVDLFQALTVPAQKSIQGIWAELFLIRTSTEPRVVAGAWHKAAEEHFDFAAGPQRIEVKSSGNSPPRALFFACTTHVIRSVSNCHRVNIRRTGRRWRLFRNVVWRNATATVERFKSDGPV